jgi:hypothetical protein
MLDSPRALPARSAAMASVATEDLVESDRLAHSERIEL